MSLVLKKPYKIEYLETTPATDITKYIGTLDKMTRYDIDKTNAAAFPLFAPYGAFITKSNAGLTPILNNNYDKFRITLTKGAKSYIRVFELKTDLSQKVTSGFTIPLELLGQDHNLEDVLCTGNFEAPNVISFYDVIEHVVKQYNAQRGTKQAFLSTKFVDPPTSLDLNEAPKNINIAIDFSDKPNCKEALQRIKSRMNLDVSRGGTGEKWGFVIDDNPINDSEMLLKIFVQGKLPGTPVTIQNSSTFKVHSIAKRKEAKTGTKIIVEGEEGTGHLPNNFHKFSSLIEEFNAHPLHDSTETYAQFTRVQEAGIHYEAIIDVPISILITNLTYWKVIIEKDVIGTFQVSPWSQNKATVVKNFFSNPENPFNVDFTSPAIIDGNAVVRESNYWRDWALLRSHTDLLNPDLIKKHYMYNQDASNDGKYEGLRILVDPNLGTLSGGFAANGGKDRFGKNFSNSIVQWSGKEWIVIRELQVQDVIVVRAEGKTWQYNYLIQNPRVRHKSSVFAPPTGPIELRDISQTFLGNDCFHYPSSISNVTGLFRSIAAPTGFYTDNSAIEIIYSYTLDPVTSQVLLGILSIIDALIPGDQVDDLLELNIYNAGWWAPLFITPFPENTLNSITENMGELFGGIYDSIDAEKRFAVLDLQNDNFTRTGKRGLNNDESTDLSEITGIGFNYKLEIKEGANLAKFKGNIPLSMIIYDTESNVWKATKNYRIHGDVEPMEFNFSDFEIYRARTPLGGAPILTSIIVPELEIRDIFERKKVKMIIIQIERSYDDAGRYSPYNFDNFVQAFFSTGSGTASFVGTYDVPHFIKKPVTTTEITTDRTIIPPILQIKGVRNLIQLENIAFAEKDLREFQYEGYVVETDLTLDIEPEAGFYLADSEMIQQSDNGPGTQQLVMKDQFYSVNGNGAKTTFTGVERI